MTTGVGVGSLGFLGGNFFRVFSGKNVANGPVKILKKRSNGTTASNRSVVIQFFFDQV